MTPDKIIRMANQIARFMESKSPAEGIDTFAQHINDFWEPRLRQQFFVIVDNGAQGLHPIAVEAAPMIRRPAAGRG